MAKVIVVNDRDEIVGYKDRNDRNQSDIIRVSGLWIFNDKKEVLIAQRAYDKVHDSAKWGPSVAGTVEEGETYVSNAIKEAQEEVGLVVEEKDLILGPHRFTKTSHQYFYQSFFVKTNLPISAFVVQEKEVAQLQWIQIEDLLKWVKDKPTDFIASFRTADSSLYAVADFLSSL